MGIHKKLHASIFVSLLALPALTQAASDPLSAALKAYEQNHYETAIAQLRPNITSVTPDKQGLGNLTFGLVLYKNAQLHQALSVAALEAQQDYLARLHKMKAAQASRYADLYLGETLLVAGKNKSAAAALGRFLAQKGIASEQQQLARARLGLAYYLNGEKTRARTTWDSVSTDTAAAQAALASAYARIGQKGAETLANKVLQSAAGNPLPPQQLSDVLEVLIRAGDIDRAMKALGEADTGQPAYVETRGGKELHFYDAALPGRVAKLYAAASRHYLSAAASDAKYRDTANFYLAELALTLGDTKADDAITALRTAQQLPKALQDGKNVRLAAYEYRQGKKGQNTAWTALTQRPAATPDQLADVISICSALGSKCEPVASAAQKSADEGRGPQFRRLNASLGHYFLGLNHADKALHFLELARDKSQKNKLSKNDPLLLIGLARAYSMQKVYSENLEIFFAMGQEYPIVRQIQEAVQGIYAMEQRSAGDVKIF